MSKTNCNRCVKTTVITMKFIIKECKKKIHRTKVRTKLNKLEGKKVKPENSMRKPKENVKRRRKKD